MKRILIVGSAASVLFACWAIWGDRGPSGVSPADRPRTAAPAENESAPWGETPDHARHLGIARANFWSPDDPSPELPEPRDPAEARSWEQRQLLRTIESRSHNFGTTTVVAEPTSAKDRQR